MHTCSLIGGCHWHQVVLNEAFIVRRGAVIHCTGGVFRHEGKFPDRNGACMDRKGGLDRGDAS